MKTIIIDGNDFDNYDKAYYKIKDTIVEDKSLMNEMLTIDDMVKKHLGKYNGDVEIVWKNSDKSREDFGYKVTVAHLRRRISNAPMHLIPVLVGEVQDAEKGLGPTLLDRITDCFVNNGIEVIFE